MSRTQRPFRTVWILDYRIAPILSAENSQDEGLLPFSDCSFYANILHSTTKVPLIYQLPFLIPYSLDSSSSLWQWVPYIFGNPLNDVQFSDLVIEPLFVIAIESIHLGRCIQKKPDWHISVNLPASQGKCIRSQSIPAMPTALSIAQNTIGMHPIYLL